MARAYDRPATYADLLHLVELAVGQAGLIDARLPLLAGYQELVGYEHFLSIAGVHLRAVAGITGSTSTHLRELAHRLATATTHATPPTDDSLWMTAARYLGVTHDVLATHLDSGHTPSTPDALDLHATGGTAAGIPRVVQLVLDATTAGTTLLRAASDAQHREHEPLLVTARHVRRLDRITRTVDVYGRALLWELDATRGSPDTAHPHTAHLGGLTPAITHPGPVAAPFEHSLSALQLLRQISHRQAHGLDPVSATSLADLASLGTLITTQHSALGDPDAPPLTGLDALQAAHARDRYDHAAAAWALAGTGWNHTVRSITQAPGSYGHAIRRLLTTEPGLSPGVLGAVEAALPRLARDASSSITRLVAHGDLLTAERLPGHLTVTWRPLTPTEGEVLAARFHTAAMSTQQAIDVARRPGRPHVTATAAPSRHCQVSRTRELTR